MGLALGLILFAIPWRRQPLWSWLGLYLRRNRPIPLTEPVTVANDRSGGGVRYQGGVAVVAVQLLGKAHTPTIFTGSTATETRNTIDVSELVPAMHQSLGLTIESTVGGDGGLSAPQHGRLSEGLRHPRSARRRMRVSGRPGW